jgi:hypothetical protein
MKSNLKGLFCFKNLSWPQQIIAHDSWYWFAALEQVKKNRPLEKVFL